MPAVRGENKIAVLLASLPPAAADGVLARLGPDRGERLRQLMARAGDEFSDELRRDVLQEFEELLVQATRPAAQRPRLLAGTMQTRSTDDPAARAASLRTVPSSGDASPPPPPSDDVIAELGRIEPDRLVAALAGEHPRSVATILGLLSADAASGALQRLAPEVRLAVFPRLGQAPGRADPLTLRIARAVIARCRAASEQPAPAGNDEQAQRMATMLKSLERTDRNDLLAALAEKDEALAAAVRERLYVFEDLVFLANQSMQKVLAEIDSKTLALALKDAPEAIVQKVMTNLSKRARETLTEEISFLEETSPAEIQQARKSLVDVFQRLDQAGELVITR